VLKKSPINPSASLATRKKDFMRRIDSGIVDLQKAMVKQAAEFIFSFSPHIENSMGGYSFSQYDANFRIGISNDNWNGKQTVWSDEGWSDATFSSEISKMILRWRLLVLNELKETGKSVIVGNPVSYANSVETGEGWEETPGYYPFHKTYLNMMQLFGRRVKRNGAR
jgi:hypothetical protein